MSTEPSSWLSDSGNSASLLRLTAEWTLGSADCLVFRGFLNFPWKLVRPLGFECSCALSLPLQRDSSSCTFATIRTSSFRFFWGCGEFSFVLSHCVLDFVVSGFSRFTVLTGGSTSVSDLDIWDNTGIAVRVSFTDSGISKGERGSSRDRLSSCLE